QARSRVEEAKQQAAEEAAAVRHPSLIDRTKALWMVRGLTGVALHVVGGPAVMPLRVVQVVVRQSREAEPQEVLSWRSLRVGLGVGGAVGPGDVLVQMLNADERQQQRGCQQPGPSPAAEPGEPLPLVTFTPAVSQPHFIKLDGTS